MELMPPLAPVRNDLPLMEGGQIVAVVQIEAEVPAAKLRSASVSAPLEETAKLERSSLPI